MKATAILTTALVIAAFLCGVCLAGEPAEAPLPPARLHAPTPSYGVSDWLYFDATLRQYRRTWVRDHRGETWQWSPSRHQYRAPHGARLGWL